MSSALNCGTAAGGASTALACSSRKTSRTASGWSLDRLALTTTIWLIGSTLCFASHDRASAAASANRLQARAFHLLPEHRIEFAVEQHLDDLFALWRTLGGIAKFGDMRVLECDPIYRIQVDAIIIGENAAQPRAGRGGEGTDADTPALEIAR